MEFRPCFAKQTLPPRGAHQPSSGRIPYVRTSPPEVLLPSDSISVLSNLEPLNELRLEYGRSLLRLSRERRHFVAWCGEGAIADSLDSKMRLFEV